MTIKKEPKQESSDAPRRMGRPILFTVNPEKCSLIEQLRLKRNLSQRELGELLGGISRPTIGRYERGEIRPKGLILQEINKMLAEENLPNI